MALPRTFVGFSSTDLNYYRLMLAWKAHEKIDFDFVDCQLQSELNSENEEYIKRKCRMRRDGRTLDHRTLEAIRRMAVERVCARGRPRGR